MRESRRVNAAPAFAGGDGPRQQVELCAFAAAIDAFDRDQYAERASIDLGSQTGLNSWVNQKAHRSNVSLTALHQRRNAARVTMRDSSGTG